jgi:HPt (histidine-containing phosphotransfer) domain-containing protein
MLTEYVSSYEARISDLNAFLAAHNMKDYETLVHSLKSTSKTIGAGELSDLALELEKASKDGDESFVSGHHGKLSEDYKNLICTLKSVLKA